VPGQKTLKQVVGDKRALVENRGGEFASIRVGACNKTIHTFVLGGRHTEGRKEAEGGGEQVPRFH